MAEDGMSEGFSPVSFNDHAGNVWIITILSLVYSSTVAAVRVYTKLRMYGVDDYLIAVATVLHLAQAIALFVALNNGFGKFNSITSKDQWSTSSRSFLAVQAMCLLILALAKCSLLALVLRIIGTRTGKSRPICLTLMAVSGIWGIGSMVGILVNCHSKTLLTPDNVKECPSQGTRWIGITAVDLATEFLTWLLVAFLSSTVNMSLKRKIEVVLAFSFRLPLLVLSILHYTQVDKYQSSAEPQFAAANSALYLQVMVLWSFISATIPNLRNFMKSFSIGMGLPVTFSISGYGSGNMYAMHAMSKNKSKATGSALRGTNGGVSSSSATASQSRPGEGSGAWRPDTTSRTKTTVHRSENRDDISDGGDGRNGSQELIINKAVDWTVTYERG
ncbi:hypothetical protein CC79DRAFT_1323388 [Sarocladium strictum]